MRPPPGGTAGEPARASGGRAGTGTPGAGARAVGVPGPPSLRRERNPRHRTGDGPTGPFAAALRLRRVEPTDAGGNPGPDPGTTTARGSGTMAIQAGDKAPDFTLKDQHGRTVSLADLRGRNVVLVFYPFAFTGVCTGELGALCERAARFAERDAEVLAVSTDSVPTLRVYAEQEDWDLPLLSDFWPHGATARAYGVLDETKGCAHRGTFVIDREGVVRWTVLNPPTEPRDPEAYLRALDEVRAAHTW